MSGVASQVEVVAVIKRAAGLLRSDGTQAQREFVAWLLDEAAVATSTLIDEARRCSNGKGDLINLRAATERMGGAV